MDNAHGPVWVIVEQIEGQICDLSFQLIGRARILADNLDVSVEAIVLGEDMSQQAQQLISFGADKVYLGNDSELAVYHPELYTAMIVDLAKSKLPEILLIGSTHTGRELAPLVAANLKTGLTAHCIDLFITDNQILAASIPAYGGLITIICPEHHPQMATVAHGVFPVPQTDEHRSGEVVSLNIPDVPCRIENLEIVREEQKGKTLESAPIVVAGGAGAGCRDGWDEISDLAELLNAALGSTRPAVDEGWIELDTMIGQSGKMISPKLYIGVGLSGELQHMVGIVDAQVMVAINNDPKAPVFEQVDYGIVEDCREFIPVLIENIKEYQKNKGT